jgi:serine/threonine-protein kinase RsbW
LRTATAGLAALLQFTLDEIEDLRIAVDEACAILLASHPAAQITSVGASLHQDAELSCRYTLDERSIEVQVSLSTLDDVELPSIHSFAWQVLRALTDTAGVAREDDRLVVTLRKQRRAP